MLGANSIQYSMTHHRFNTAKIKLSSSAKDITDIPEKGEKSYL